MALYGGDQIGKAYLFAPLRIGRRTRCRKLPFVTDCFWPGATVQCLPRKASLKHSRVGRQRRLAGAAANSRSRPEAAAYQ